MVEHPLGCFAHFRKVPTVARMVVRILNAEASFNEVPNSLWKSGLVKARLLMCGEALLREEIFGNGAELAREFA